MVTFPIEQPAQRAVLGVAITFTILTFTFVCLRLLAHRIARKPWTSSDYLIVVSAPMAISLQAVSITGVLRAGIGWGHVIDIVMAHGPGPITLLLKLLLPLQFLWVLSLSLTKVSILLLYIRIFPVGYIIKTSYATMGVITAWAIATIIVGCLICQPIEMNWDQEAGGSCGDQVLSFTITGVINLLTDLVVVFLPMPALFKLQLAVYKKITLVGVFGLGFVTCIISALRISVLSTMDFEDITYSIPLANIFSCLEPCIAIILSCVPLLKPLLGKSKQTPNPSGYVTDPSSSNRSKPGNRTFQPLEDDSSQYNLRPLGTTNHTELSVAKDLGSSSPRGEASDQDSLELGNVGTTGQRDEGPKRINVKTEWDVSTAGS